MEQQLATAEAAYDSSHNTNVMVALDASWRKARDDNCGTFADDQGRNGGVSVIYEQCVLRLTVDRLSEVRSGFQS